MKYSSPLSTEIDCQIEKMFDLSMSNSAFRRVVPSSLKTELRNQYLEYLTEQKAAEQSEQDSSVASSSDNQQTITVNISALRKAGYCVCPKELAAACENILRKQVDVSMSEKETSNAQIEKVHNKARRFSVKTIDCDLNCDADATADRSEISSPGLKSEKKYPAKIGKDAEFSQKSNLSKSHQSRKQKRKYFTKYMSDEFSKDTKPVNMEMMDSKTKELFKSQQYNELVSDITGIF